MCNDAATDTLLHQIRDLYTEWANSGNVHLSIYWDIRLQRFVWLNGPNGTQNELLVYPSLGNDTITGFGIKPRSYVVRRRLNYLRRTLHFI